MTRIIVMGALALTLFGGSVALSAEQQHPQGHAQHNHAFGGAQHGGWHQHGWGGYGGGGGYVGGYYCGPAQIALGVCVQGY